MPLITTLLPLLSALYLSYTVLSAGISRLTSPITPEQILQDRTNNKNNNNNNTSSSSSSTTSLTTREVVGILDLVCGGLLLVPRCRRVGGAVAFALLLAGLVARVREGREVGWVMGVGCMGLCVVVVVG